MPPRVGIVLFRKDLRLSDNPALVHVCDTCDAIVPVFIWNPEEAEPWPPGAAARYWLHQSLSSLDASLRAVRSRLVLAQGPTVASLLRIARSCKAAIVAWNRRYEPHTMAADARMKRELEAHGLETVSFNGALLKEPWEVKNKAGGSFRVFTPFWNACLADVSVDALLSAPKAMASPARWPASAALDSFRLDPLMKWTQGIREAWRIGETAAAAVLDVFLDEHLADYRKTRDQLDQSRTSHLSPYLAAGEISPRQVWYAVHRKRAVTGREAGAEAFLRQLYWREFAYHLLYHEPATPTAPLRPEFARFSWRGNEDDLRRWEKGRTGYPVVDAAMSELWRTGYMHNRARMVVASFLVKDLLIPWLDGAKWFWDTLVDADLANNTFGWQWTAGCGADAAPFFRIFNPVRQGERFDPRGAYVRHWLPELAQLPDPYIHRPWEAPPNVLAAAHVALGETYPRPIVDHSTARAAALAAYRLLRA